MTKSGPRNGHISVSFVTSHFERWVLPTLYLYVPPADDLEPHIVRGEN